jgi:hypothetical protein
VRSGTPVARVGGAGDAGSNRGPDGPTLPSGGGPRVGGRPRFAGGPRGIASSRDDLLSVARPFRRATGIGDRIGRVLIGAAESLVAVLLLFGVTLAFALVQNRIDRNDPKLALAPMRPEVIPFA